MVLLKSIFWIGVVVALTRACSPQSETHIVPSKLIKPLKESNCILYKANLDNEKCLDKGSAHSFDACRKKCLVKDLCSYFGFDIDQKECKLYIHPTKTSSPNGQVYFGRPNCEDETNFTDWKPYPCESRFHGKSNFEIFYKNVEHFYCKKAISNAVRSNSKVFKSLYSILKIDHSNLLFSPYSVMNILMLFMAGIESESASKLQIINAAGLSKEDDQINTDGMNLLQDQIRYGNSQHGKATLENRVFYSTHHAIASQKFVTTVRKIITDTSAVAIDFYEKADTTNVINDWVKNATNNLITKMVDENSFSEETLMMILNAVYFKGNWEYQFAVDDTQVSQFKMPNKPSSGIYMMKQTNNYSTMSIPDLNAEAIEVKYMGGKNSMIIMLPNTIDGLPFLEKNLKNFDFKRLKFEEKGEVDLRFPKFAFDSVIKMDDAFRNLGITDVFDPQLAKFHRFDSSAEISVSDIIQKAVIKVDEFGTEAASVTSAEFELTSDATKRFIVDHPFFFIIRDNPSGMILFGGRITDASTLNQ